MNKKIIIVEGATHQELADLREEIKNGEEETIFINNKCQLFEIKDGQKYEVISSLKKITKDKTCDDCGLIIEGPCLALARVPPNTYCMKCAHNVMSTAQHDQVVEGLKRIDEEVLEEAKVEAIKEINKESEKLQDDLKEIDEKTKISEEQQNEDENRTKE